MDRTEHLAWAQTRAIEYLDQTPPNVQDAISSFVSDLGKHEGTAGHPAGKRVVALMVNRDATPDKVRAEINGAQ